MTALEALAAAFSMVNGSNRYMAHLALADAMEEAGMAEQAVAMRKKRVVYYHAEVNADDRPDVEVTMDISDRLAERSIDMATGRLDTPGAVSALADMFTRAEFDSEIEMGAFIHGMRANNGLLTVVCGYTLEDAVASMVAAYVNGDRPDERAWPGGGATGGGGR